MQPIPEERDEDEERVAGVPYKEFRDDVQVNVRTSIAVLRISDDPGAYASVNYMYRETTQALEREDEILMKYDLILDGKKQQLLMVKMEEHEMNRNSIMAFDHRFVTIGVQVSDMVSCMALELGDRERWAPVVLELVAATQAYLAETGIDKKIYFKDNLRQYGKYWKGKSALGINADTEQFAAMLECLSNSSYGSPKYFSVDTGGQVTTVKFSMGPRTTAVWGSIDLLGLMQDYTVVITGFDQESYADANVGTLEGRLCSILGPVMMQDAFRVAGMDNTMRVTLRCVMGSANTILSAIQEAAEAACQGHPIKVGGRLITIVWPDDAEKVYKDVHGKEVREPGGGGRLLLRSGGEVPVSRRILPRVRTALSEADPARPV